MNNGKIFIYALESLAEWTAVNINVHDVDGNYSYRISGTAGSFVSDLAVRGLATQLITFKVRIKERAGWLTWVFYIEKSRSITNEL